MATNMSLLQDQDKKAIELPATQSLDEEKTHQYRDSLPQDISVARKLLEEYSGIAPDQVVPHIFAIHAKALLHPDPYPCITSFRFLQFHISSHPLYTHILNRFSAPGSTQTLLDLGYCFEQDLHYFAFDGALPHNLYGADLHPELLELGYELFNDRDRLGGHFVAGDIFAAPGKGGLYSFARKMDMISATAFFHLFSREDQIKVCEKLISFLKPLTGDEGFKQVIFGRQSATTKPGVRIREEVNWGRKDLFLHNIESFRELWDEVGEKTGTKWLVKGELRLLGEDGVKGIESGDTARLLYFEVWRLE